MIDRPTPQTVGAYVEALVARMLAPTPGAVESITGLREYLLETGKERWGSWCWVPMAASLAYIAEHAPDRGVRPDVVQAAATWSMDRAVLVPADDAAQHVLDFMVEQGWTRPGGDLDAWRTIPVTGFVDDVVGHLPSWCPYVLLPAGELHGFFLWLESDANTDRVELRLLLDEDGTRTGLSPVTLYLDRPTLGRAVDDYAAVVRETALGVRGSDATGSHDPDDALVLMLLPQVVGVLPFVLGITHPHYAWVAGAGGGSAFGTGGSRRLEPSPDGAPSSTAPVRVWRQVPDPTA